MDDFAQLAETADLSRLAVHASDDVSFKSFVEGPDGRAYLGTQSDGQFNTVADLAWAGLCGSCRRATCRRSPTSTGRWRLW